MVKKLGTFLLIILSSVLMLYGCGDPYKNFALSVSTQDIVLYLNDDEENTDYPSSTTINVKVAGTSKSISGDITITQYAFNGVDDIVNVELVSGTTSSKDGATYKVSATKAGRGKLTITTNEGNKTQDINIVVYVPVKGASFTSSPIAVKYGGFVDLSKYMTYSPEDTNQKEMTYYISDSSDSSSVSDGTGITETVYARINDNILTSRKVDGYPMNNGEKYINVYGVSKYDSSIRTQTITVPVLEIVDESEFVLETTAEDGTFALTKNNLGYYDIILGHNIPTNPYVYSRELTVKLSSDYTIDQKYSITSNKDNKETDSKSIFEATSKVEDQDRYSYNGIKQEYPYKKYDITQIKTGTEIFELYVDRVGYEGMFTMTIKVRIIVKDFATELNAYDSNGNNVFTEGYKLVVYNAYGNNSLGTPLSISLAPNPDNNYKVSLSISNAPPVDGNSGLTLTLANGTPVYDGSVLDSGTKVFIKHSYTDELITDILAQEYPPTINLTYYYNLAPSGVSSENYVTYSISRSVAMEMKLGVTDIRIPSTNSEIKINAVTGKAINKNNDTALTNNVKSSNRQALYDDAGQTTDDTEIVLATIDNQPADLKELISSIKVLSVNEQPSTMDAMNNKYFSIVYKEGKIIGRNNRLVLEPNLQAEQARVVLEISTTNDIVKRVTIDIFVPITYGPETADKVHIEINNEKEVSSDIYFVEKHDYYIGYTEQFEFYDENYQPTEEDGIKDIIRYTTFEKLTLAIDSRVGINVYNYVVLNDAEGNPHISKVNYNSNIIINQNREYFNIEYDQGSDMPYIVTKKVKTPSDNGIPVEIKISGYNNNGDAVEFTKVIYLVIIEPITSISLTPENRTVYVSNSLGSLKEEASKVNYSVITYPVTATLNENVDIKYSFDDKKVLYSLRGVDANGQEIDDCDITVGDILTLIADPDIRNNFTVQAIYKYATGGRLTTIEEKANRYSSLTDTAIDSKTIIDAIFSRNIVIDIYAQLKQYSKPIVTTKTQLTIKKAQAVEKIIPSVGESGLYFDTRLINENNVGKTITFNVLPQDAYNKTLIAEIEDDGVAKIIKGVDSDNRIIGNQIVIAPSLRAGRTYIRISAEDSYYYDRSTNKDSPSKYLEISIRVADGSKEYPFEISDPQGFLGISEDIASGNNKYYYMLTQSFTMAGEKIRPFGTFAGGINGEFTYNIGGIYYSQQHSIQNLTIEENVNCDNLTSQYKNPEYGYGLFSQLTETAEIENLILNDIQYNFVLTSTNNFNDMISIGSIAGINKGKISNSFVTGSINVVSDISNVNVGGLTGKTVSVLSIDEDIIQVGDGESNSYDSKSKITGVIAGKDSNSDFTNNSYNSNVAIVFKGTSKLDSLLENTQELPNINLGGVSGTFRTYTEYKYPTRSFDGNGNVVYLKGALGSKDNYNLTLSNSDPVPDTRELGTGITAMQYVSEMFKSLYNLNVVANITSITNGNNALPANIGGVVGYSDSTLADNIEVIPVKLYGYKNIGGVFGFANASHIMSSLVEFANQGQTGIDTATIVGATNVGGMIGYGIDVNIAYSYVRAYFNGQSIDNSTYYGNMMLFESNEAVKSIGGLIGTLDSRGINEEINSKVNGVDSNGFEKQLGVNNAVYSLINQIFTFTSSSNIRNSYFNADINAGYTQLSNDVYVGGLVGNVLKNKSGDITSYNSNNTPSTSIKALNIKDSYVYGNIARYSVPTYSLINYVPQDSIGFKNISSDNNPDYSRYHEGKVTYYVIGTLLTNTVGDTIMNGDFTRRIENTGTDTQINLNNFIKENGCEVIKVEIEYVFEEYVDEANPDEKYLKTIVTFSVVDNFSHIIGNDTMTLTTLTEKEVYNDGGNTGEGNTPSEGGGNTDKTKVYTVKTTNSINTTYGKNVELKNIYTQINNYGTIIDKNVNNGNSYKLFDIVSEGKVTIKIITTIVDGTQQEVEDKTVYTSSNLQYNYALLKDQSIYNRENRTFKVDIATDDTTKNEDGSTKQTYTQPWIICEGINNNLPVLFDVDSHTKLLFKILPTNITINILDEKYKALAFNNLSFIKDGENLVLFYNELTTNTNRVYGNLNKYRLVTSYTDSDLYNMSSDNTGLTTIESYIYPLVPISFDLDIADISKYGLSAIYDKGINITSSNRSVLEIVNSNTIRTVGTGTTVLKVSSKLDSSITKSINVLVVSGISDFNLYQSKNLSVNENKVISYNKKPSDESAISHIIDTTYQYWTDTINEDSADLIDFNNTYIKNTSVGFILEVFNEGEGQALVNNVQLEKGVTYLYNSFGEFNFRGNYNGIFEFAITPFIKSEDTGFGTTLTETASSGKKINNCIVIEKLKKYYKFNIIPRAESITIDKAFANLDPVSTLDLTITTITSSFTKIGESYEVDEVVYARVIDTITNRSNGSFTLDMTGTGTNNSLLNIELLEEKIEETDNVLKVKLIQKIRISFNAEKYRNRTGGVTYNLNDVNYRIEFYPYSNIDLLSTFDIKIIPRNVNEVKMSYYASAETMEGGFYPQEAKSEYIVPARSGLLKLELTPNFSNADYITLTVDDNMGPMVAFAQQLAVVSGNETNYITGYQTIIEQPEYLPGFKGLKLKNQSMIIDGSQIYYNNWYYVLVTLNSSVQENQPITFRATSYKTYTNPITGRKEETEIRSDIITLKAQPLPSVSVTVDGKSEGIIAKGSTVQLEVNAVNFEGDIVLSASTANNDAKNVEVYKDVTTGKWYLNVNVGATAGDTVIVNATASKTINNILENVTSSIKLYIVEYLITGVRVEGTTYIDGRYEYEALSGTTHPLKVILDTVKDSKNTYANTLIGAFESEASGITIPYGSGDYINNWWRLNSNNEYESMFRNTTYTNFQFASLTMSDFNNTHYFAIKTKKVSNTDVISYRLKYYYDNKGIPNLYTNINYGYDIYELTFDFVLVIKDNSTYDHPNPIGTVEEFMALGGLNTDGTNNEIGAVTEGHYILVNDIVLDNYYPFNANFSSLDGNGHYITIKGFNTDKYKAGNITNIGLFETVSENTVIKNITIDISDMLIKSSQARAMLRQDPEASTPDIDLMGVTSFTFGILAGENNGSITNAKIISTKSVMTNGSSRIDGNNLLIASTTGYINGGLVDARVGGLVGINNGTISNSYVGLNAVNYDDIGTSEERHSNVKEKYTTLTTYPFTLIGGKNISAFVNTNNGIVANCYALGVGIINTGVIFEGTNTAGFVVENSESGNIFNSMVEGIRVENYRASQEVSLEGKGFIGGFVYQNSGKISNAYSNIYITTNSGGSGGFVYNNDGSITNAYSTAKNSNNSWAHGAFTGIDDDSEYNNNGTYLSCFYLVYEGEVANELEPAIGLSGKASTAESANNNNPFRDTGSFNGFNFAAGQDINNVWLIDNDNFNYGPRLVSASSVDTFSHRVLVDTVVDADTNQARYDYEYDNNEYYGSDINPLLVNNATEFVTFIINNSRRVNLGKNTNAYVFGITSESNSQSSSVSANMPHYVRIINNLDFSQIILNNLVVDGKHINDIVFAGRLDGNGMTISGLRLVDQNQSIIHENYGLFNQIGLTSDQKNELTKNSATNTTVKTSIMNINIEITGVESAQAVKVGALAGSIYDTALINIKLSGKSGVYVRGQNIVGGLAGLIINTDNSNNIVDITTDNVSVVATFSSSTGNVTDVTTLDTEATLKNGKNNHIYYNSYALDKTNTVANLRKMSYAGSIAGIINGNNRSNMPSTLLSNDDTTYRAMDVNNSATENIRKSQTKPSESKIYRLIVQNGGYIAADHAGGLFGLVDENTHIKSSKYLVGEILGDGEVSDPAFVQEIRGYNYAGGIVGENYGMLEQVYVEYISKIQKEVDDNFNTGKKATGEKDNLFGDTISTGIGGIAGYSGVMPILTGDKLTYYEINSGTFVGSIIVDSYSRVNVINARAKSAGGIVGVSAGANFFGHVYTTASVYASSYIGGLIGLYNKGNINGDPYTQDGVLQLDYAFALNQWTSDVKNIVSNNLWQSLSGKLSDQSFKLTFPEIGNTLKTGDTDIDIKCSSSDTIKAYAGSLIGYVNKQKDGANYVSGEYDINGVKFKGRGAVTLGRRTQLIGLSESAFKDYNKPSNVKFNFSTVISTTFNDANILKNNIYYVGYDSDDNKAIVNYDDTNDSNHYYTPSFDGQTLGTTADNYTPYYDAKLRNASTYVGDQLKLSTILGKNSNKSLFNMYIWDTLTLDKVDPASGSKIWRINEDFPEYIIGIFSNFVTITTDDEYKEKVIDQTSTRNQFFLIDGANNNTINISSQLVKPFEGTMIGIQKDNKNSTLKFNVNAFNSGIFKSLKNASFSNIDFEITIEENIDIDTMDYYGFIANIVDTCSFNNSTIKIINKGDNTISHKINLMGMGLAFGRSVDTSINNVVLDTTGLAGNIILNNTTGPISSNIAKLNIGGFVGESIRTTGNGIDIVANTGNNKKVVVSDTINTEINIGSLFGSTSGSTINNINVQQLNKQDINNIIVVYNNASANTSAIINYGGMIGNMNNSQLSTVYVGGNIEFGSTTISENYSANIGGAVGRAINSNIQDVNVNEYVYNEETTKDNNKVVETKRSIISTTTSMKVNIKNIGDKANTYTIGGIVGSGINTIIGGNRNSKLVSSNALPIKVTYNSDTAIDNSLSNIVVGGVVGHLTNNSDSSGLFKVYNIGAINIENNKKSNKYIGGIVGRAMGGKYEAIYNVGEMQLKESDPSTYNIGGIMGTSETNSSQNSLILTKFINFADINIIAMKTGAKDYVDAKPSADQNRLVGGVAGKIEGDGSNYEGGYTLARLLYTTDKTVQLGVKNQDNKGINGIAYANTQARNVYFVLEFMPYSNFTNNSAQSNGAVVIVNNDTTTQSGGIPYAQLVPILNKKLSKYFVCDSGTLDLQFATKSKSDGSKYSTNLPTVFKNDNNSEVEEIDINKVIYDLIDTNGNDNNESNNNEYGSVGVGSKLNPIYFNTAKSNINTYILNPNYFYIFNNDVINGKTIKIDSDGSFNGLITTNNRNNLPTVKLDNLSTNYGFISNIKVLFDYNNSNNKYAILENNYGNIVNCITYNIVNTTSVTFRDSVSAFVYNNHGNIVQSGSTILIVANNVNFASNSNNQLSGFVNNNFADGFIKDCYSTMSIINSSSDSVFLRNANIISGFVVDNKGVIETSYYAGKINAKVGSVFASNNTGVIRKCYYDGEAMSIKSDKVDYLDSKDVKTSNDGVGIRFVKTQTMLDSADSVRTFFKYALATTFVPSSWKYDVNSNEDEFYNFGYATINSADKVITLLNFNGTNYSPILSQLSGVEVEKRYFPIIHAGQLNTLSSYQDNTSFKGFILLTNIDMSKINFNGKIDDTTKNYNSYFALKKNFNGLNHTISNLTINSVNENASVGLFATIESASTVSNLRLYNFAIKFITKNKQTGALAGQNNGTINNVTVEKVTIETKNANNVGGIVGENYKDINYSIVKNSSAITGNEDVGGMVGSMKDGNIIGDGIFYNIDNVTINGQRHVGGLVGNSSRNSKIERIRVGNQTKIISKFISDNRLLYDSIANGETKINSNTLDSVKNELLNADTAIGGVVGLLSGGTVQNCTINSVELTGDNGVGGVAGIAEKDTTISITDRNYDWSSSAKSIKINGRFVLGGIVGYNKGTIQGYGSIRSYISANIGLNTNNCNTAVGGVAGINTGAIRNVEVNGSTINGDRLFGGIAGLSTQGTIYNCYVSSTTFNYLSDDDIDQDTGYMDDSLRMGISNANHGWTNNDFNSYFGFGGRGASKILECANIDDAVAIEYGGIETKLGSNTKIAGKNAFKPLFGFITGAKYGTNVTSTYSSISSQFNNLIDEYRIYRLRITSSTVYAAFKRDTNTVAREIKKGVRKLKLYGNTTSQALLYGDINYYKYDSSIYNEINGSDYFLNIYTNDAASKNIDALQYLGELSKWDSSYAKKVEMAKDEYYYYAWYKYYKHDIYGDYYNALKMTAYPGMSIDFVNSYFDSKEYKSDTKYYDAGGTFGKFSATYWSDTIFKI